MNSTPENQTPEPTPTPFTATPDAEKKLIEQIERMMKEQLTGQFPPAQSQDTSN